MKFLRNEQIQFLGLFVAVILIRYLLPPTIVNLALLVTLPAFWFSRRNYFWFGFFFLLVDAPGMFFSIADPQFHLPSYNLFPGVGRDIFIVELFIMLALVKASIQKEKEQTLFYIPLMIIFTYFIFLFIYSMVLGISTMKIFNVIRRFLPYSLIYSICRLFKSEEDYVRLLQLLFPVVFIGFLTQIYEIIFLQPLSALLGGNVGILIESADEFNSVESQTLVRTITCPYISIATLIGALYYYTSNNSPFRKNYLIAVIFIDLFLIVMSGTRGWIAAYIVMLFLFFLIFRKQFVLTLRRSLIPAIVLLLFITVAPSIIGNFKASIERFSTVESVIEGDLSAGNTAKRYTEYTPFLLEKWIEKPVFGWAFSDQFFSYNNPHAGYPNLLMNAGIVGILLFLFLFVRFVYRILFIQRKFPLNSRSLSVFLIGLTGFMIINASSMQFFGFLGSFHSGQTFTLVFFLVFTDRVLKSHILKNLQLMSR